MNGFITLYLVVTLECWSPWASLVLFATCKLSLHNQASEFGETHLHEGGKRLDHTVKGYKTK